MGEAGQYAGYALGTQLCRASVREGVIEQLRQPANKLRVIHALLELLNLVRWQLNLVESLPSGSITLALTAFGFNQLLAAPRADASAFGKRWD